MNPATAPWADRRDLIALAATLEARFVCGAVRDSLLGHAVADIDLATPLSPETVIARVRDSGFKPVPTGIAHGTITAVLPDGPVEVTTLRRDVSTDGRHAVVSFPDDWREDAHAEPRDGDALPPESVREPAHEKVTHRLGQRERDEERALVGVRFPRVLTPRAVQRRELLQLQRRADYRGDERSDDELG